MSERILFRSLYSRIAFGFIALLAALLLAQTLLFLWLTNSFSRTSVNRSPSQLASTAATDLASQLTRDPNLDVERYLKVKYGRAYQPFAVVLRSGRAGSNRPSALPGGGFIHNARIRLERGYDPSEVHVRPREDDPFGAPMVRAEYAQIEVGGAVVGLVAVPSVPPPLSIGLWELAPTLTWAGMALLAVGAVTAALLIFRPTHKRLRRLEEAARALGEGRVDVRASEAGGDEVTSLSRTFNRMADDLQSRAVALSESDRARRQLLADVSHELMTPLSAIRGYIETLSMPELALDPDTRKHYLDIVHQETHKLETIIGDLLDLARLQGGDALRQPVDVSLPDLFERIADRHRPILTERRITLATELPNGPIAIWGDAERLEQALQNVAANAIRHTPEGGRIVVRGEPAGDRVRITVSDSGPGIPPEHLAHIFDRFYKADASRAGTTIRSGSGLGLSIVQAIVERHRGEVHASNIAGGGARFELLLPSAATR
jgi:signal transduction histidine kinase